MSELVLVGAIAGAFGVKGEVKIKSFTGVAEDIFAYGALRGEDGKALLDITAHRAIKDGFAARAKQVTTRERAEALKSTRLYVRREDLPDLDENEYYHADLIGLPCENLDGDPMGRVKAVYDFGAGDMLEISHTPGRKGSWYLPFSEACVPHVDIEGGKLVIDPPEEEDSLEESSE